MKVATHQQVPLRGSARDRRKAYRELRRRYPGTPFEAICAVPKRAYMSRSEGGSLDKGTRVMVTFPVGCKENPE